MPVGSSTTPDVLDARMWRRLKARCHPDAGGDHELFVWVDVVAAALEGRGFVNPAPPPPPKPESRVERFVKGCLQMHAEALMPLSDWWEMFSDTDESPPATPKQVAYIARLVGMTNQERYEFYDVCETFGLTRRAASYLIEEHKSYA